MVFEKRKYESNSSPNEINVIRSQTSVFKPEILLYKELPVASEFTVQVMKERIFELVEEGSLYSLIVDISESSPPDGKVRFALKATLKTIRQRIKR